MQVLPDAQPFGLAGAQDFRLQPAVFGDVAADAAIAAKRLARAEADVRNSLPFPEPEPRPKQAQMWEARDA